IPLARILVYHRATDPAVRAPSHERHEPVRSLFRTARAAAIACLALTAIAPAPAAVAQAAARAATARSEPLTIVTKAGPKRFDVEVMRDDAARARGLDTCPQAAFVPFHRIVAEHFAIPPNEQPACGMSPGHADPDAIENRPPTHPTPQATTTYAGLRL
ncbi:hypothetical protein, partial [Citrobacter sp. VF227]